jgi:mRNA interferase HicA
VKRRDLKRHLRAHGAQLLCEGGNHSFWGFDAEHSSAVPRHREIDFRLANLRRSWNPAAERVALMPGLRSKLVKNSARGAIDVVT